MFKAAGPNSMAIHCEATNSGNVLTRGGYFLAHGQQSRAVEGRATATGGTTNYGGHFTANASFGVGVYGSATGTAGVANYGGQFYAAGGYGSTAVYGEATGVQMNYGGQFYATGGYASIAVYGEATGVQMNYGGFFKADSNLGTGVYARGGASGFAADFDGTTRTKVLQITGGADLAEPFSVNALEGDSDSESAARIEPGMVVVIDPDRPGQLKLATTAYDSKVAGVISGAGGVQPGMVMSGLKDAATKAEPGAQATGLDPALTLGAPKDEHAVALTGRVWCWCDATHATIEPGDLLTTSTTAGHAMWADQTRDFPRGCVVGKAMTKLESGKGLVLVLVQPQ